MATGSSSPAPGSSTPSSGSTPRARSMSPRPTTRLRTRLGSGSTYAAGEAGREQTDDLGGTSPSSTTTATVCGHGSLHVGRRRRRPTPRRLRRSSRYDDATEERQLWTAGRRGTSASVFAADPRIRRGRRMADQRRLRRRDEPDRYVRARCPQRLLRPHRSGAPSSSDALRLPRQLVRRGGLTTVIRHVVVFRWSEGVGDDAKDAVAAGLAALPGQTPAILAYRFGPDAQRPTQPTSP